jgi:hypothetical protein
MTELVPVIVGATFGAVIRRNTSGKTRFALSIFAAAVSGAIATLASGEYLEGWTYLLLDLGEAALGLVVGYVIAARRGHAIDFGSKHNVTLLRGAARWTSKRLDVW